VKGRRGWSSGEGGINGEEDWNWERIVASAWDKGRARGTRVISRARYTLAR